ncbi:conserved hypothetical protein [Hyphomonas neptunium ATCC 15444]|uniref:YdhG-like domain-containing protein n=2 Tax=Hyphomonas TaxID=85 RepID=Q0BWY3_HYPNA|nr:MULTISPECIES: DUF1801 domain-containing protein [Hyphomonas]ABI75689.1 conserved hypothetical protein [Hyphomonas neptunium ATCC 15444]KCZ91990.1 hypothetical protein HHI_12194 [Hyphomonas hirschiana VP5]
MARTASLPSMMPAVAEAFAAYPAHARARLLEIRQLILESAATLPETGRLTETLKWGEPAYLPEAARTGTTIRIAWSGKHPASVSLFVNCQTTLVEDWRAQYDDTLTFIGNREIRLPLGAPLPAAPLRHCIAMALTYHKRKSVS